jgi:hypothetical protein
MCNQGNADGLLRYVFNSQAENDKHARSGHMGGNSALLNCHYNGGFVISCPHNNGLSICVYITISTTIFSDYSSGNGWAEEHTWNLSTRGDKILTGSFQI